MFPPVGAAADPATRAAGIEHVLFAPPPLTSGRERLLDELIEELQEARNEIHTNELLIFSMREIVKVATHGKYKGVYNKAVRIDSDVDMAYMFAQVHGEHRGSCEVIPVPTS